MSSRYGVGAYGLGNYSAATTVSNGSTMDVATSQSEQYERLRNFKASESFLAELEEALAYAEHNASSTSHVIILLTAIATYVRQLVGEATLQVTTDFSALGNYTTDGAGTFTVSTSIEMNPYIGPYWNPENQTGLWVPETISTDIWVPETSHPNPWG